MKFPKDKQRRYEAWLVDVETWADKHRISVASALSILSENDNDEIQYQNFFAWIEVSEFLLKALEEIQHETGS